MKIWPRELWWRIWLAGIASIVVFALLAGFAWRMFFDPARINLNADQLAEAAAEQLPVHTAPRSEQQTALDRIQHHANLDLALYESDGTPIAMAGRPVPPPRLGETESHWLTARWRALPPDGVPHHPPRPAFALRLPDERWLVVRREPGNQRPSPLGLVSMLALIAIAVGVGTFPVARRLTRRLDRLRASVDALGAGDLTARFDASGNDEVARLAERFNLAAMHIEALVNAQKSLLANASHELRSPLARIRMAVEMLGDQPKPELFAEVRRNVTELDQLVEEILLASRMDAAAVAIDMEPLDLTAIAAEECARADAALDAQAVEMRGDARLLRRVLRNLLDNARRHGGATPVEVKVTVQGSQAVIEVCDRGPGIASAERERIFEPFYRAAGGRERDGGVGLGLALVRQIARRHGGDALCLGRDGGGACFEVRLPLRVS